MGAGTNKPSKMDTGINKCWEQGLMNSIKSDASRGSISRSLFNEIFIVVKETACDRLLKI